MSVTMIRNQSGQLVIQGEWEQEETFTPDLLAHADRQVIRVLDGHIIISGANGSARYVITDFRMNGMFEVVVGRLLRGEFLYRVDNTGERITE